MHLTATIRSLCASMRAGAALGRASRLRAKGHLSGALAEAKAGLALLNDDDVQRDLPTVAASLICLSELIDQVSSEMKAESSALRPVLEPMHNPTFQRTTSPPLN